MRCREFEVQSQILEKVDLSQGLNLEQIVLRAALKDLYGVSFSER